MIVGVVRYIIFFQIFFLMIMMDVKRSITGKYMIIDKLCDSKKSVPLNIKTTLPANLGLSSIKIIAIA
jgi:hypothetical protein